MPSLSVTGEVYCFPRRQLIFSVGNRVIYHSKGLCLWEYIPKSIPSVCTTIFKRIAGLHCYSKSLMYTSIDSSWRALQTNGKFFFQISNSSLNYWPKTEKYLEQTENRGYWSYCNVLCINGFVSTSSTNKWKVFFFNFGFVFELLAEKWKIFKRIARHEYWSNCNVLYINEFVSTSYTNLWKFFFQILESFFELTTIF